MKKYSLYMVIALVLLLPVTAGAQSAYDAAAIAQEELGGSARFVGMGGAMSALGGDLSVMSTNPAGLGIYRSNDVGLTFGYESTNAITEDNGFSGEAGKNRWTFDQVGFVISSKFSNVLPLRYVNFGFSYHRAKSFYKNMSVEGMLGGFSQTFQMADQADGCTPEVWDDSRYNHYTNPDIGWLSALGYNTYLIGPSIDNHPTDYPLVDDTGAPVLGDEGEQLYEHYDYYSAIAEDMNQTYGTFRSKERGGIDEYDFSVAFNISDRVYIGLTLGAHSVDYSKYTYYDEDYGTGAGYLLESFNRIDGAGVDVKAGIIVRPLAESPLRLGLAVHSPTFYKLTYTTGAAIAADAFTPDGTQQVSYVIDTRDFLDGADMERDFELQTPWRVNLSAGYTVGSWLAFGAEYEYEDYGSMKMRYPDGYHMDWETEQMATMLQGTHTFRVGAELKPISKFSIRAGYNHVTSAYADGAWKDLAFNSINTDTDYANRAATNRYTVGVGYRGNNFYADLAYQYAAYDAEFYPFANMLEQAMPAAVIRTNRSHAMFTLGFRF